MEITESALADEIDLILNDGEKDTGASWYAYFSIDESTDVKLSDSADDINYVPEEEATEGIYKPTKLLNVDWEKDYELNAADGITLTCSIPLGLWAKVLYPQRDHLRVTIKRVPLRELTDESAPDEQTQMEKFICVPKIEKDYATESKQWDRYSRYDLDMKGIIDVSFQLFDQSFDSLRLAMVGGILRRNKPGPIVRYLLKSESDKITIDDGASIDTINMVDPDNTDEREHFNFKQGVPLISVARYVHKFCGGLYNSGTGQYYHDRGWWVYPLYNTERFDQETKTLTIIKVPQNQFEGVERTYRTDGDKTFILATSDSDFLDNTEIDYLNEGNGVRFADARRFMGNFGTTKDNKIVIERKKNNHEFINENRAKRNYAPVSVDSIHANPFLEYTELARRRGSIFAFNWDNARPDLFFPGMMVKILYLKGSDVRELHGVLLKVHVGVQLKGQAITSNSHKCGAMLYVFANPVEEVS